MLIKKVSFFFLLHLVFGNQEGLKLSYRYKMSVLFFTQLIFFIEKNNDNNQLGFSVFFFLICIKSVLEIAYSLVLVNFIKRLWLSFIFPLPLDYAYETKKRNHHLFHFISSYLKRNWKLKYVL